MSVRLTVRCPAKVNLFLSVGPPDAIGYHPIRTVFQAVSLSDTLVISVADGPTRIECDWPGLPAENTLTKALRLAAEFTDLPSLSIRLDKSIPAQSGLGGGSSDAAGLIRALGVLTDGRLGPREQHEIACAVGADVPFFLVGGRAKGEGYGERLTPLPDTEPQSLLIVRPPIGVDTAAAYRGLDISPRAWHDFPENEAFYNDFERVAPRESLEAREALLATGAKHALLCGSGSATFGVFPSATEAEAAAQRFAEKGTLHAWVARTLARNESLELQPCSREGKGHWAKDGPVMKGL
ncbi:MAG: 4-(cytidine 5'-diphospho)-2-C-methyl-D-erythritol kinase [Armatimonadetes bacterium]|nr:4-(cytidine 5'-diphospho)-2-C-methyl-D-erythritol kinase [Armatimonadota bacterium]